MACLPSDHSAEPKVAAAPRRSLDGMRLMLALALALTAAAISAYLFWVLSTGDQVAGCGPGAAFACGDILSGRWSRWLGIPVTLPAALVYCLTTVALGVTRWQRAPRLQRVAWKLLVVAAGMVSAAGCWFLGIQIIAGSLCPYCIVAHFCGLLLAAIIIWHSPIPWRSPADQAGGTSGNQWGRMQRLLPMGVAGAGILVVGQLCVTTRPRDMKIIRLMNDSGASVSLNANEYPRLGKADAKYIVVMLYTYNCVHCRALEVYLDQALDRYGTQLAILPLVVPLHPDCNVYVKQATATAEHACAYARLAVAVWMARPAEFASFHRWLIASLPTPEAARGRALELVGEEALTKLLADGSVNRQIAKHVRVYAAFGGGQLPRMIHGRHTALGEPASAEQLFNFLEKDVGILPPQK